MPSDRLRGLATYIQQPANLAAEARHLGEKETQCSRVENQDLEIFFRRYGHFACLRAQDRLFPEVFSLAQSRHLSRNSGAIPHADHGVPPENQIQSREAFPLPRDLLSLGVQLHLGLGNQFRLSINMPRSELREMPVDQVGRDRSSGGDFFLVEVDLC